jgi:hypothetical protein
VPSVLCDLVACDLRLVRLLLSAGGVCVFCILAFAVMMFAVPRLKRGKRGKREKKSGLWQGQISTMHISTNPISVRVISFMGYGIWGKYGVWCMILALVDTLAHSSCEL